jgi:hypothetical protein
MVRDDAIGSGTFTDILSDSHYYGSQAESSAMALT